jgi:ubiquitin-conjugating enzyme E2 Q
MTRSKFKADTATAAQKAFKDVTNITRGDCDGELVFTYSHGLLAQPIQIRILADVDLYPDNGTFMIFTDTEDVPQEILNDINAVGNLTARKTVSGVIEMISLRFARILNGDDDDEVMTDRDECHFEEEEEEEEEDDDDEQSDAISDSGDDEADENHRALRRIRSISEASLPATRRRLRRDFRKAKEAGFRVGLPRDKRHDAERKSGGEKDLNIPPSIVSLSIRVRQLNLPDEALEAWDLRPEEYVVLLIRLAEGYPTLQEFFAYPGQLEFRIGKCRKYKPCLESAQNAFGAESEHVANAVVASEQHENSAFSNLFISNSLELLMKSDFANLLKLRLDYGMSWDEAQELSSAQRDRAHIRSSSSSPLHEEQPGGAPYPMDDTLDSEVLRADIQSDLSLEERDPSIAMHAMHFALVRLVKCTTYCMVCHRKANFKFEAVKPYVCANPLCEFQYMELGFGPSIEHEIITQPLVVDLLVSFCYNALANSQNRGIPKSLQVKVPAPTYRTGRTEIPQLGSSHHRINVHSAVDPYQLGFLDRPTCPKLKAGDFFVVVQPPINKFGLTTATQIHHCRAKSISTDTAVFELISSHLKFVTGGVSDLYPKIGLASGDAELCSYEHSLEELPEDCRADAMLAVLQTIPSVQAMKNYLAVKPGNRLGSWDRISKSALDLLRWIIASNRSFIVQLDDTMSQTGEGYKSDTNFRKHEKVLGIDDSWVQFRFAQGSPMKEERFHQELAQQSLEAAYPTLFAWHGSPLRNWHNIIREGLNFSREFILHGRAYGDGVYFSNDFNVSIGYTGSNFALPGQLVSSPGFVGINEANKGVVGPHQRWLAEL